MKVTVVFPTKNQSEKLLRNIREKAIPYFDKCGMTYDAIITASGSTPEEYKVLEEAMPTLPMHFRLLPYDPTPGKGYNVKKGFEAASGDYFLFMDSDMATDLATFDKMKPYLGKSDILIASRYCKGGEITVRQPFKRRFVSKCSRILIKMMFRFKGIKDTQCGYKCIRKEVAEDLIKKQKVDGFAFDVEYLYIAKLKGYSVAEIPCRWADDGDSTVGAFSASVAFFRDMLRIKRRKKSYRC